MIPFFVGYVLITSDHVYFFALAMALSWNEIKERASSFSKDWSSAHNEEADAKPFLDAFFNIFGISRKKTATFEQRVQKLSAHDGYIDLLWKGVLLVEMKSKGKNLDKAYEQAISYTHGLKEYELPKYILVCDFERFRLFDLEADSYIEFTLADLVENVHHFGFIAGYQKRIYKEQDPVNIKAAELMGALHDQLRDIGYTDHPLEVYLVRLLFCLFAEDTTIFQRQQFQDFITDCTNEDGSDLAARLQELFQVLNTPQEKRFKNLDERLAEFPYVNGKLFEEPLPIASFSSAMREALLQCCALDWSKISPAIFGAMFQSVMDSQKRRNLGAHYTSEKNILKVIRPLFLDDLYAEFESVKSNERKLQEFHRKLAAMKFFDPACGCGNFLVITYRELRLLELAILRELSRFGARAGQSTLDIRTIMRLDVDMMYGIEYEEFPARIAEVAMWLIDHQMNMLVSAEFGEYFVRLPLRKSAHIVHGNALRIEWDSLLNSDSDMHLTRPSDDYLTRPSDTLSFKETAEKQIGVHEAYNYLTRPSDTLSFKERDGERSITRDGERSEHKQQEYLMRYQPIPPKLLERARELRKESTRAEQFFWRIVRNKQFGGWKFRRQHVVGKYILDFYCHEAHCAIELDGGGHAEAEQQEYDAERTAFLEQLGIHVLRIWNNELLSNSDAVLAYVFDILTQRTSADIHLTRPSDDYLTRPSDTLSFKERDGDKERNTQDTLSFKETAEKQIGVHEAYNYLTRPSDTLSFKERGGERSLKPLQKFSFILGNPPFIGTSYQNAIQKSDMALVMQNIKGAGVLDFVTAWYIKAAEYIRGTRIKVGFVSTNSISQGEQVGILWQELFRHGCKIHFAHRTFSWSNEARGNAAVHVVIIGFACFDIPEKRIFEYQDIKGEPLEIKVKNINPYLVSGNDVVPSSIQKPICNVPVMQSGSAARDGGFLILTNEEAQEIVQSDNRAKKFLKRFVSGDDFLNNIIRWCIWLKNESPADFADIKTFKSRFQQIANFRSVSTRLGTKKMADYPYLFAEERQPDTDFLLIPKVSSENRKYIPIAYLSKDNIVSDKTFVIPHTTPFHFGVLTSAMHMAWMRYTCGRLESRYSYSNTIVYNNFPWCEPNDKQQKAIEQAAERVLAVRAEFPESSLADLYDPLTMPPALVKAHQDLDKAVDTAYRAKPFTSETERVEYLFLLYEQYTANLFTESKPKRTGQRKK